MKERGGGGGGGVYAKLETKEVARGASTEEKREESVRRVRGRCEPRMIPAQEAEVRGVEHTLFHPQSSIVAVCPDSPLPVRGSKGQSTKGIPNMSQRAVGRRPTICWLPLSEWVYIYPPMRKKDAWRSRPPLVTTGRLFRRPRHPPIIVDLASTEIRVLLDV